MDRSLNKSQRSFASRDTRSSAANVAGYKVKSNEDTAARSDTVIPNVKSKSCWSAKALRRRVLPRSAKDRILSGGVRGESEDMKKTMTDLKLWRCGRDESPGPQRIGEGLPVKSVACLTDVVSPVREGMGKGFSRPPTPRLGWNFVIGSFYRFDYSLIIRIKINKL